MLDNDDSEDIKLLRQIEACYTLRTILNDIQLNELILFMIEDSFVSIKEIVEEKDIKGIRQIEEDYWFKYIFIDQHKQFDDYYYGHIYVPLPNGKFISFSYEC